MNDFEVISRIGSGGFGNVFLVSLKNDSRRQKANADANAENVKKSVGEDRSVDGDVESDNVFAMKVIEKVTFLLETSHLSLDRQMAVLVDVYREIG
jgi:serine/threonine protein kinase